MGNGRPLRFIHIGTGGWGEQWCRAFLPHLVEAGRIAPAAAVDIVPAHLDNAVEGYGIQRDRCFTDAREAFEATEADFAVVVIPPEHREEIVDLALSRNMDILAEKPLADTMAASARIYHKVRRAGRKLAVTMSHRFDQDQQSLQRLVHSGRLGALQSVVGRFTDSGGRAEAYRSISTAPDVLLVQGSVHHFDIFRALAGSNAARVYARTWNPSGARFTSDSSAFVIIEMENGVICQYEGALANAATLNGWEQEYFRAECEEATAIVDSRRLTVLRGGARRKWEMERVPLLEQARWQNAWLAEQFVDWLEGGPAMETRLEDNIQCCALLFAAVESAHSGRPVEVQELLRSHLEAADG